MNTSRPKTLRTLPVLLSAVAGLSACATFENGASEEIHVVSDPPGATVSVSFSDEGCVTPCSVAAPRARDFTLALEKSGYQLQQVKMKARHADPKAVSHDLTPDYLGRVLDAQAGAGYVHDPNPVVVKLVKAP